MDNKLQHITILFFGIGSIGKKHAQILKKNFSCKLISYRTNKGVEKNNLNIKEIYDLQLAFDLNPDIAFITNPTYLHAESALECAKRNIHLFIEKPISHNLKLVDVLEKEILKRRLITYVSYNLRFHPVLEKIRAMIIQEKPFEFNVKCSSYLPDWRPKQDYTWSYSVKKNLGGGVTLDLSHEFDYITWLFGEIKEMKGYCDKVSDLDMNCEDILEAELICKNGVKGSIHLDCFSKKAERFIKLTYRDKEIKADLLKNSIKIITDKVDQTIPVKCEKDETYKKQLDYFINQYYKKNANMMNNYSDALKTFKKLIFFRDKNCRM
jgi:predicted dehydrogenase